MIRVARLVTIVAVVPLLAGGCGTSKHVQRPPDPTAAAFSWKDVPKTGGDVQTGTFQVPIDYSDPSLGNFTLAVARHLATKPQERIGTLLVNRGGPGFASVDFAIHADQIYSDALLERFDIVAWDPRGTGASTPPIDCISDYDAAFAGTDITPETAQERQAVIDQAKSFADACVSKNALILQHVATNDSARDMDTMRRALGEAKISYFGFSYGSELGATWATMFPDTVRAAALDGAVDPSTTTDQADVQQAAGFEKSLDTFLEQCSADKKCAFHNGGHADTAFDALMQQIDDSPIATKSGRPLLTRNMALYAVGDAMYSQALWPQLAQALADAQKGDGAGLLALWDEYYGRQPGGTYDNSLEAFQVISCMDDPSRPTVAQDDAQTAAFRAAAPRFAPGTVGDYFCTFFPPTKDPRITITGKGAGPILVMGTTGDPATPLASSANMAKALENGHLVIVTADQHTGYGVNDCSRAAIDDYLVDPVGHFPADGTRCD